MRERCAEMQCCFSVPVHCSQSCRWRSTPKGTVWRWVHHLCRVLLSSGIAGDNDPISTEHSSPGKLRERNVPQMAPIVLDAYPVSGFHPSTNLVRCLHYDFCVQSTVDTLQSDLESRRHHRYSLVIGNAYRDRFLCSMESQFLSYILVDI